MLLLAILHYPCNLELTASIVLESWPSRPSETFNSAKAFVEYGHNHTMVKIMTVVIIYITESDCEQSVTLLLVIMQMADFVPSADPHI